MEKQENRFGYGTHFIKVILEGMRRYAEGYEIIEGSGIVNRARRFHVGTFEMREFNKLLDVAQPELEKYYGPGGDMSLLLAGFRLASSFPEWILE